VPVPSWPKALLPQASTVPVVKSARLWNAPGGYTFGPPKSRRSERTIALDAETGPSTRPSPRAAAARALPGGPAYHDRDLVFCDELGGTIAS
jgi:hypothetical protein